MGQGLTGRSIKAQGQRIRAALGSLPNPVRWNPDARQTGFTPTTRSDIGTFELARMATDPAAV